MLWHVGGTPRTAINHCVYVFPCANNGVLSRGGCAGHLLVCRCCLRGAWQPHSTSSSLGGSFTGGDCSRPVVSTVCPLWWCDFCCDLWSVPSCEPSAGVVGWAFPQGRGPSIRRLGHRSSSGATPPLPTEQSTISVFQQKKHVSSCCC